MKREGIKSVIFFVLGVGMVSLMLVASGTANAGKPPGTPSPETPGGPPPETPAAAASTTGPVLTPPPAGVTVPPGRPESVPPLCDFVEGGPSCP